MPTTGSASATPQLGLLTADEVEASIRSEFNPVRVGFHGTPDVWTRDVLNVGVSPDALIQTARAKLEGAGGAVLERTALQGAWAVGRSSGAHGHGAVRGPVPDPQPCGVDACRHHGARGLRAAAGGACGRPARRRGAVAAHGATAAARAAGAGLPGARQPHRQADPVRCAPEAPPPWADDDGMCVARAKTKEACCAALRRVYAQVGPAPRRHLRRGGQHGQRLQAQHHR